MSRKTKIILVASIVLIIIILIILFLLLRTKTETPPINEAVNTNVNSPLLPGGFVPPPGVIMNLSVSENTAPEASVEDNLKKLAINFTERFGSFSNQGQYENIKDLKPMMTVAMIKFADSYILKLESQYPDINKYYGITTKAINATVAGLDKTKGIGNVVLNTQRREAAGSTTVNARVFYSEIKIRFVHQGENWLVDGAYGF